MRRIVVRVRVWRKGRNEASGWVRRVAGWWVRMNFALLGDKLVVFCCGTWSNTVVWLRI